MIPKFNISKTESLHLTDKWITNGHWMVKRDKADSRTAPKALKTLLSLKLGSYRDGLSYGLTSETTPDCESIIPTRNGYLPLSNHGNPETITFKQDSDEINAYIYKAGNGESEIKIGVAHKYVPLLRMGYVHVKAPTAPIIILDSEDLNGELIAIVMPMRL